MNTISESIIIDFLKQSFNIDASIQHLCGYLDQNYLVKIRTGEKYILKISSDAEEVIVLEAQNLAMKIAAESNISVSCPVVIQNIYGKLISQIQTDGERGCSARLLTFLDGVFWVDSKALNQSHFRRLGKTVAEIDKSLQEFCHPGTLRNIPWDIANILSLSDKTKYIVNPEVKRIVEYYLYQFELFVLPSYLQLRKSVIHNDGNDHNILLAPDKNGKIAISGLIDFGDLVYTQTVNGLAVTLAYALFDQKDPLDTAATVLKGYHQVLSLEEKELDILYYLIAARLCATLILAGWQRHKDGSNEYHTVSEDQAAALIKKWLLIDPDVAKNSFRKTCGYKKLKRDLLSEEEIINIRESHIGKALSISYDKPLKITRGAFQYLLSEDGNTYLDAVNNVPHVGHSHPAVVRAASRQMAQLNTNTRYLHDYMVEYATKITATMPDPLDVCFFVCTGSEANELALRMARNFTNRKDIIVVDGAYHGNTTSVIEISPYKFDGPGGKGAEPWIHTTLTPDPYRGLYRGDDPENGKKYARHIKDIINHLETIDQLPAAFICESMLGCGGQIVLPDDYMKHAFEYIRNAGSVCIADEVQVGFGRAGSHFWAFEAQEVTPDIVTLGKPIGNGFPLAAVVTTHEIADAFANGMEYFNTFGGNPVSCAIGLEVLNVIKNEGLQENALQVGNYLMEESRQLMDKHPLIGDVRGLGLYIGIELVRDRKTLQPADTEASSIINRMKEHGILISADGPLHNVLKIKPPMVFTRENAIQLVDTLDIILTQDFI